MQAIRRSVNASGKKEPREILFQNIGINGRSRLEETKT